MAINYPTPIKYSSNTTTAYNVRSVKSTFGDGYQEVTPDGINSVVQGGNLSHQLVPLITNTNSVSAATLRTFLKLHCGTSTVVVIENFMEDPTGATTLNVYLNSWSESYVGTHFNITVRYREAFNV